MTALRTAVRHLFADRLPYSKQGRVLFGCLALQAYLIFELEGSQQRWKGRL